MKYCPTEIMIAYLYIKPLQGKLFRLFWNLILNLREEDISNMAKSEELTKMEEKIGSVDHAKFFESAQDFVVGNKKSGSLSTCNDGIGSDAIRHTVYGISYTCNIIALTEVDLLSRLISVVAEAA